MRTKTDSCALGEARWVALIDVDEFIVPMRDTTIPRCLKNHFSKAGAVYVNWRNFVCTKPRDACSKRVHDLHAHGMFPRKPS